MNGAEIASILIMVLQSVVLARGLGPGLVGQYSMVAQSLMMAVQWVSLGLPASFLYHSKRDPGHRTRYLMDALWVSLIMGVVGGSVMVWVIHGCPKYFGHISGVGLAMICLYVPLSLVSVMSRNCLLVDIEAMPLALMRVVPFAVALTVLAAFWAAGGLSVYAAMVCMTLVPAVRTLLGAHWTLGRLDLSVRPTWPVTRDLLIMGVRLSPADLMVLFNNSATLFIVKHTIDTFESVGYYSRASQVALALVAAGQSVLPLLFSRWAGLSEDRLGVHIEKVMRLVTTLAAVGLVGLLVLGKWAILLLFGEEFRPAISPMLILLPGTALYLLARALIQAVSSRGRPEVSTILLLVDTFLSVTLCVLLIPYWGINGAALGATIGHLVLFAGMLYAVKVMCKVRPTRCLGMGLGELKATFRELGQGRV